ncbi:alkylhydroperoxidase domain protein [Occultella gossypii]|uniref:alkylhydroperoxidase domain protein n=1 Tax=Occultella gossypii TaxID=2800820 RepID=UPI001CBA88BE|nr:alkylhydroperoxidase domain protein [Occultella gossypii]
MTETTQTAETTETAGVAERAAERVTIHHDVAHPEAFTREPLGWLPWLTPLREDELTERHYEGLVEPARAKNDYFALLARDPEVLGARTRTDLDIFYNTDGGLPRAERELAAAATSRVNGCVFCASVHARLAVKESGRDADVDRLLADGVTTDLDPRWNAIVAASVALTATPPTFDGSHVRALREAGLADEEIVDVINGSAFFNWANRLMLSLGEPRLPRRRASA